MYRFARDDAGFHAHSVEERLGARFDGDGVHISSEAPTAPDRAGEVTLRFAAWGRVGAEREVAPVEPVLGACNHAERLDENGECLKRLELRRNGIVEWWDNTSRGLQQAWTIDQKPAGSGSVELRVDVEGATASSRRGNAVELRRADGSILSYDELHILDASGRTLEGTLRAEAGRIFISFDDRGATYPITVDPLTSRSWFPSFEMQEGAYFGLHMTSLGDVNGDEHDDVAVGAHAHHGDEIYAGKIFVYYGALADSPSWEKVGENLAGGLGYGLAGGDFNGDGYGDLLTSEVPYGRVHIFFGSSSGLANAPGWSASSGLTNDGYGWSVASAGDVNGDRISDVIVGAPFTSTPEFEEGKSYLYLGAASNMSTSPVWTRQANHAGARLGFSVAGVGDVNGDGRSDVLVGGPGFNAATGKVWGYLGTASGLGNAVWSPDGTQIGENFGHNVAPAGDENGDGFADVLVGAPGHDSASYANAGRLFVYSSTSGSVGFGASSTTQVGTFTDTQLGLGLSGAGDINGDGKADALLGGAADYVGGVRFGRGSYPAEPDRLFSYSKTTASAGDVNEDGFADALFGDPWINDNAGTAHLDLGRPTFPATSPIDPTLTDGVVSSQYGSAVADAGDFNGDGYSELLVGAPQFNAGAGKAHLYFGNGALPASSVAGTQPNAHLGTAFAGCDFNNDGYSDMAVSAPDYDGGQVDEGRVSIYRGSASGVLPAPIHIEVNVAGGRFGAALAAGDVNGDGLCDLGVGSPLYDNVQSDRGRVYVFHGPINGPSPSPNKILEHTTAGALFGSALSFGDVTFDGRRDLAVGAPGFSNGEAGEGRVDVYFASGTGLPSNPSSSIEGNSAGASFGAALSMNSDIDENGLADLVVGAPNHSGNAPNAGRLYYYEAEPNAGSYQFIQREGIQSWTSGDKVGSVIATGDINGDGYGDVAFTDSSSVRVRLGTGDGLETFESALLLKAGPSESLLGRSLSLRGDVNGDGSSDLSAGLALSNNTGGVKTWRLEKGGTRLQVRRAGTSIPIAPGGKSTSNAVDVRLFARTPHGRMRVKMEVSVSKCNIGFSVKSPTWTDTGVSGTWLTLPVTGLQASTSYWYRARIVYEPLLGWGATRSRWYYGGNRGHTYCDTHFRTP